jgi:hypothetical protein
LQDEMARHRGSASGLRGSGALAWVDSHLGGQSTADWLALASRSIRTNFLTRWASMRILYPVLKFLPAKLTSVIRLSTHHAFHRH